MILLLYFTYIKALLDECTDDFTTPNSTNSNLVSEHIAAMYHKDAFYNIKISWLPEHLEAEVLFQYASAVMESKLEFIYSLNSRFLCLVQHSSLRNRI